MNISNLLNINFSVRFTGLSCTSATCALLKKQSNIKGALCTLCMCTQGFMFLLMAGCCNATVQNTHCMLSYM